MATNPSNMVGMQAGARRPDQILTAQVQDPNQKSALDKAMGILNTPGGAALIGATGAGIQAYGANKSAAAGREQNAQQFAASMANDQLNSDRNFQQNAAIGAANASPLGAEQNFAQRNAIMGAILGNTQNFSATPGDPRVAKAMGSTNQGGMRIPEGGFDPAMLERMFGDQTTMQSIANRQQTVGQINPRGQALNLGSMYGDQGIAASQGVMDANTAELDRQTAEQAKQRELIMRAIDEDIRGERQQQEGDGPGFWGKLGKGLLKVGKVAAPIALAATGVGLPAAVAAGAALNAADTKASGGSWLDAAISGGMGAGMGMLPGAGGLSGVANTAAGQGTKAALAAAAKNPMNYLSAIGGR